MKIGITYDLKGDEESPQVGSSVPDDWHEEFDSPVTIEAIATVLRGLGHEVVKLGDGRPLLQRLLADPPEFVFNFAEGHGVGRAREARVPAVLEMLGIPYTGSDPLTLAATLDKDCAKRLVASAGVAVPEGFCVHPDEDAASVVGERAAGLCFPAIIKPAWEGSSKGIRNRCVVRERVQLAGMVTALLEDYRQPVLVEEYIAGDELTIGIVGNQPAQIVGVMRVVPNEATEHFVYSLEVKRDFRRQVRYECPAPLSTGRYQAVEAAALKVYRILGCRDVSRIDFRLRNGVPYFLEVNPLPGLNPESSDLVIMAGLVGWSYERLVQTILQSALTRVERLPVGV
jgi:D-alanine-D-alanine ligase